MLSIERIIYVYIFVCLSVIVFNIGHVFITEYQNRKYENTKRWIQKILPNELNQTGGLLNKLISKMASIDFLNTFVDVLMDVEIEKRETYIKQIAPSILSLSGQYKNKKEVIQACFAFNLSRIHMGDYMNDELLEMLMRLLSSEDPYSRQNALLVFYRCHNPEYIIKAYIILNNMNIYHYDKLIIDGTLSFLGDKTMLGYGLLNLYLDLNEEFKLIVINVLKGIDYPFYDEVNDIYYLTQNMEIQIAILRYFARWKYPPFEQVFYNLLSNTQQNWELRAVSASCLRSYPNRVNQALLKMTIQDSNWYVRYNSAESLAAISKGVTEEQFDDPYASDIMKYMKQKEQLQRGDF